MFTCLKKPSKNLIGTIVTQKLAKLTLVTASTIAKTRLGQSPQIS